MPDFIQRVRDLGGELEAKQADAQVKWTEFDALRSAAADEGVDFMANADAFDKLDEASKAYDAVCDEVNSLQAKYNRLMEMAGEGAPKSPEAGQSEAAHEAAIESIGDRFMKSATIEYLRQIGALGGKGGVQIGTSPSFAAIDRAELKATLLTTAFPSQAMRRPGIVPLPQESLSLLDLLPVVPTDSETIEWVYEKTFTNVAAETAEADETGAPEGTLEFDKDTVTAKWIPFFLPSTRQILADEPRMRAWVEGRLVYGVRNRLQAQCINGTGNLETLKGIANWPGILTQDMGANSPADVLHRGKTRVIVQSKGNHTPSVVMLHPNDEERLVLDTDEMGRYRFGGPESDGVRTIWGMIPIVHPQIAEGAPIVGDIVQAELYVREGVSVNVTDSHEDYFRRGMLAWVAGGRFAFAVLQPKAFCQITDFGS